MERFNCLLKSEKIVQIQKVINTLHGCQFTTTMIKIKKLMVHSQACNENSEDVLSIIGDWITTHMVQSIDETELVVLISDVCNKMMNFGAESYVAYQTYMK